MTVAIITAVVMTLPLQKSPKWWNLRNQTTLLLLINLRGNQRKGNWNCSLLVPRSEQMEHRDTTGGRRRRCSREMSHRDVKSTQVPVEQGSHCRRPKWAGQQQLICRWQQGLWRVQRGRRRKWGESGALNSSYSASDLHWERGNSQPHFDHHGRCDDWWG